MKLKYERPETEVNEFKMFEICTTSGGGNNEPTTNPGDDNTTPFPWG